MKRFREILCAIDPDQDAVPAVERAVTLAENNQANLSIVSVIEGISHDVELPDGSMLFEDLRIELVSARVQQLEEVVTPYMERLDIQLKVLTGTPFLEIIREVLRNKYDLLVKSAEKQEWLHNLFGSDDMHLLRMNPCPVWLIKQEKEKTYRRILAAIDVGGRQAMEQPGVQHLLNVQVLEMAGSLALSEFAELHVVHAWEAFGENFMRRALMSKTDEEINAYVEQIRQHREQGVETLIREVGEKSDSDMMDYLKPQMHLIKGWPRSVIPELEKQIDADLIVMGTVARTGIPGFIIGNTAESILNQINCSVLSIKPDGFVSPVTLEK